MPDVLDTLRAELEEARRAGDSFARAWPVAFSHALRCARPGTDRMTWSVALEGTRHQWSASFYGVPASRLEALADMVARAD